MLNQFQRACADAYAQGDFAHVETIPQAREMDDTLFTFLMIELGSSEGCDTQEEALRRLEMAVTNIQDVIERVSREGE